MKKLYIQEKTVHENIKWLDKYVKKNNKDIK